MVISFKIIKSIRLILRFFFQRYHERQQQHNAASMEQAVRREFWFSSAMDKLRQPRGRANEENEITSSQLPNPSAPKPVTECRISMTIYGKL